MTVELTNHYVEMSAAYEVEKVISERYGSKEYFKFYYGNGKYSREYSTPGYTYRIINKS